MINFIWTSNLPLVVGILFLCRPLNKVWNPSISGECWPPQTFINIGYWQGAKCYFSVLRFDARSSAYCLLMECADQTPDQSWNLYNRGNGHIHCRLRPPTDRLAWVSSRPRFYLWQCDFDYLFFDGGNCRKYRRLHPHAETSFQLQYTEVERQATEKLVHRATECEAPVEPFTSDA